MTDWTIELEYTSTIRIGRDRCMRYLPLAPEGKLPATTPRDPIRVRVKTWLGKKLSEQEDAKPVCLPRRPVPPPIHRLILELLQLTELPRRFSLELAWVLVCHDKTRGHKVELNVYDCVRSDQQTILHGMFDQNAQAFSDLEMIAQRMKTAAGSAGKGHLSQGSIEWAKWAGFASHDVRITNFVDKPHHTVITIVDTCRVCRYPMGEYCRALPIPPFPEAFKSNPKHAVVVATYRQGPDDTREPFYHDSSTWDTLDRINEVVRSTKQIILLMGKPGSGKELYARTIHHLSCRPRNKDVRPISTAGLPWQRLHDSLCGTITSGGHHIPGDIAKATHGTLMLDEFDKACTTSEDRSSFYSWLLRVLEAGEYWPAGGNGPIKYDDVAWILAGAFEKVTEVKKLPSDFWSRLSSEVRLPSFKMTREALTSMFLYWYFVEVMANNGKITPLDLVDKKKADHGIGVLRDLLGVSDVRVCMHPTKAAMELIHKVVQKVRAIERKVPRSTRRSGRVRGHVSPRTIRQATRAAVQSLQFHAKGVDRKGIWEKRAVDKAVKAAVSVVEITVGSGGR